MASRNEIVVRLLVVVYILLSKDLVVTVSSPISESGNELSALVSDRPSLTKSFQGALMCGIFFSARLGEQQEDAFDETQATFQRLTYQLKEANTDRGSFPTIEPPPETEFSRLQ